MVTNVFSYILNVKPSENFRKVIHCICDEHVLDMHREAMFSEKYLLIIN